MNQIETGRFIKALRKEKGLTQRELAESLNVSEKTVSKWETGNGLPEVSLMLPLCKILGISVNELLSGKRLEGSSYYEKAEENIVNLIKDVTSPKKKVVISTISCILVILSALALILIASFLAVPLWTRLVLIGIAITIIVADVAVILLVAVSTEVFECSKCGEKFVPTLSEYILGAHTFKRRYLKCPHCGKKSWNKSGYMEK